MKKIRALWQSVWGDVDRRIRLGRILGFTFIWGGFAIIGVAWNGAASKNFIQGQFPYVISGGVTGLGLIVTGGLLLLLATVRSERQIMSDKFDELSKLLGRNLSRLQFSANGAGDTNGQVVATSSHYHRVGCTVLEGKKGLMTVTLEQAAAEGLEPCRVCEPPLPERKEEVTRAAAGSGDGVGATEGTETRAQ